MNLPNTFQGYLTTRNIAKHTENGTELTTEQR